MSDYGEDDFSDFGDEWLYVEDEYMAADDLAEHAVNSPPPITYADDDLEEWDRFDYFNDLEYASDGYDDGDFYTHNSQTPQAGQKRKRGSAPSQGKKKRKLGVGRAVSSSESSKMTLSPVAWRSQKRRDLEPKVFDEKDSEPYALLKDWRERLAGTPTWVSGAPQSVLSGSDKEKTATVEELLAPTDEDDEEDEDQEESGDIDSSLLMGLLEKRMAEAGGPLVGMDQQDLLQSVLRMMENADAADDIAGELADSLLKQGMEGDGEGESGDETEGDTPADLLNWLSKQRESTVAEPKDTGSSSTQSSAMKSPEAKYSIRQPPTPPSSEANRSVRSKNDAMEVDNAKGKDAIASQQNGAALGSTHVIPSRKRKATDNEIEQPDNAPKKRAMKSFQAPTAASQAKTTTTARSTRNGHASKT